jgi:transposase
VDYVLSSVTVTGQYYADLIRKLTSELDHKRPNMRRRGVILLHDNARAHISHLVDDALTALRFKIKEHPPYSPDLAPSDYHHFPNLKNYLRGKHFESEEEVKEEVNNWIHSLPQNFFEQGIDALLTRSKKCKELGGGYILD